jgi:hypothetical protein
MSDNINSGGSAFPVDPSADKYSNYDFCKGMSLRDWFAGMALQGLISAGCVIVPLDKEDDGKDPFSKMCFLDKDIPKVNTVQISRSAYKIADEMIRRRDVK